MKMLRIFLMALLAVSLNVAYAASKEQKIVVPSVGVPDKQTFEFTPEQIHRDSPVEQKCSSCHNQANEDTEFKAPNHFLTTRECDQCHSNKSWIPLRPYTHLSGKYRPNSSPQECDSCHTTNSEYRAN